MNQLNDKERVALMADMKSFDEEMPSIGIFLYNPQDHCLVDVDKKELTPREVEEARAKGVDVINYPLSTLNFQLYQRKPHMVVWFGTLTSSWFL